MGLNSFIEIDLSKELQLRAPIQAPWYSPGIVTALQWIVIKLITEEIDYTINKWPVVYNTPSARKNT